LKRLLLLAVLAVGSAFSQSQVSTRIVNVDPSGVCVGNSENRFNERNSNLWGCVDNDGDGSGTWTRIGSIAPATATNCADSAGDAACGSAAAGAFVIDVAATSTVVSTTAVTADSQIFVQFDSSLGTRLGITCNTTPATVAVATVTARTAGTSFTVHVSGTVGTNPACFNYHIVN